MKKGKEDHSIRRVGGHLINSTKKSKITWQRTYSRAARPILWGGTSKCSKKNKKKYKNRSDITHSIPRQNLRTRNNSGNVRRLGKSIYVRDCRPQCGLPKRRCSTLPSGLQIELEVGGLCHRYEEIKAERSSEHFKIKAYEK